MSREQMIRELIGDEGFRGNGFEGIQQVLRYANLTDLEVVKLWVSLISKTKSFERL